MTLRKTLFAFLGALLAFGVQAQSFDELLKAVEGGDVKTVAGFLDRGLDPNTTDTSGHTLLMTASRLGHLELARLLIARKASVTRRSVQGDTALMFASLKGHVEVANLLVTHGAQLQHDGWGPLHYAAFEGRAEVIRMLVSKGAPKDGLAPNGYTALMLAARGGHLEAARALLYEDADVSIKAPDGLTALAIAKGKGTKELEELLRRAGAVE
jgi:ankyrin repeat protein